MTSQEDPGQIVREEWMLELPPEINPNGMHVCVCVCVCVYVCVI